MPITIEEFQKLSETKEALIKKKYDDLIAALSEQAYTTKEVAVFLGTVVGTAYGLLRRLEKKGIVVRRFDSAGRSYWIVPPSE